MSPTKRNQPDEAPTEQDAPDEPEAKTARRGWFVPAWLAGLVVLALALGAGFGIGRWTDDGHGRDGRPMMGVPGQPGNGGNGSGRTFGPNGGQRPVLPGQGNQQPSQGSQAQADAFLGVSVQNATGSPQGAEVVSVAAGSPAATAGFKAGDVITALDGNITSASTQVALNAGNNISSIIKDGAGVLNVTGTASFSASFFS